MAAPQRPTAWNEEAYKSLCIALSVAIMESGGTVAPFKDQIVRVMAEHGHSFTWEAIRYVHNLCLLFVLFPDSHDLACSTLWAALFSFITALPSSPTPHHRSSRTLPPRAQSPLPTPPLRHTHDADLDDGEAGGPLLVLF